MLRALMAAAGARPEDTVVVGDMEVDFEFARAAGCRVVLIPGGSRTREELSALDARRVSRKHRRAAGVAGSALTPNAERQSRIPLLMTTTFDPTGGKPGQVRFFLPGPVWVRDAVRQAMAHEAIGHRGKAFADLYARIPPRLQKVFRTEGFVFTTTSAATGLWEAALLNLAPERVLAIVSGAFSERWAACARDLGIAVDVLEAPWGSPVDPDEVRRALGKARYEAVTVVHSETSTGTLNDLAAIARAVREASDAFVLADVVTSIAGSPVECDAWGLDFVLSGSQKALALPPGLGVAFASDALPRAREGALPRALPAPLGGGGLRREEPDALHAVHAAPLRARRAARPHPRGDRRGALGAARRAAPPGRGLGRRARATRTRRPRARGRGPSRA